MPDNSPRSGRILILIPGFLAAMLAAGHLLTLDPPHDPEPVASQQPAPPAHARAHPDDSGYTESLALAERIQDPYSLEHVRDCFAGLGDKGIRLQEERLRENLQPRERMEAEMLIAKHHLYEGRAKDALDWLGRARAIAEHGADDPQRLSDIIFTQGVAATRLGENENCVAQHCNCSCILPIRGGAVHRAREGSEAARRFFLEYLERNPEDRTARWMLAVVGQTLGDYPANIPERFRLPAALFTSKVDIGRFTDIAAEVGVDRYNQAGGAIMDDFDNDGLLDIVVSSFDRAMPMAFYKNKGDGTFEERTAGLSGQLGGLYCVQADYDNDGWLDIFVPRGAWGTGPTKSSLLHNNHDGTFTDVGKQAGVSMPMSSQVAAWADYDNDGRLDLFVGGEQERSRLYHNRGDGTFEEVAIPAGVANMRARCKGANWGDYDGDGYPDLLVNNNDAPPRLYHNNRNGTFTDVAPELGITSPQTGFSCFFLDYDNDGHPDIYLAGYDRHMEEAVKSLLGEPNGIETGRLFHNRGDGTFEDVTARMGLDVAIVPMGSNFFDADNDGYLDLYFGTKAPPYSTLLPNRMFKNMEGRRFEDISYSSGTAHLQKGHCVAAGDWDRDGNVDVFVELGGATPGDRFRNVLFQNPGHDNDWVTLKLVGQKTNRSAIGAKITIKADRATGRQVCRFVTSGSSFGGNPLEQTIGIGHCATIPELTVYWPTSRTTQVFHDVPARNAYEITEFASSPRKLDRPPVPHRHAK